MLVTWEKSYGIYAQRYGVLVADFSAQPLTGTVPLTVTFTNLSTPTNEISGYVWAYGDATTSTTSTLMHTHTYTVPGVYTVTLAVSDGAVTDTLTRTDYITANVAYTTTTRVITYTYDDLYRLVDADYSTGEQFEYGYGCISLSRGRTLKFGDTDMGQSQGVVGHISRQGATTASEAHFRRGEGDSIQARPSG